MTYVIAALYKFAPLPHCQDLMEPLRALCDQGGVEGTLLLAEEGINGTLAGSRQAIDQVLAYLRQQPQLADLEHKESTAPYRPFHRLKVKLKKEIVTLGVDGVNPAVQVGQYVEPEEWNALIQQHDVLVVDTRNDFEVRVGTFPQALDPQTPSFSDFPKFVQQTLAPQRPSKIAMFCTGGIRCEKATSYLLNEGFEKVYHLKGGILRYLERIKPEDSLWQGECFVFDQRVSVAHGLKPGSFELCFGCQSPLSPEERSHAAFERGVSCLYCVEQLTASRKERLRQRMKQVTLAEEQGERHIGLSPKDFKKRRQLKEQKRRAKPASKASKAP